MYFPIFSQNLYYHKLIFAKKFNFKMLTYFTLYGNWNQIKLVS